jgi:hypothetical protein
MIDQPDQPILVNISYRVYNSDTISGNQKWRVKTCAASSKPCTTVAAFLDKVMLRMNVGDRNIVDVYYNKDPARKISLIPSCTTLESLPENPEIFIKFDRPIMASDQHGVHDHLNMNDCYLCKPNKRQKT